LKGQFFWDIALRHWMSLSRRFEWTTLPVTKGRFPEDGFHSLIAMRSLKLAYLFKCLSRMELLYTDGHWPTALWESCARKRWKRLSRTKWEKCLCGYPAWGWRIEPGTSDTTQGYQPLHYLVLLSYCFLRNDLD
jgi:hypothetical protein